MVGNVKIKMLKGEEGLPGSSGDYSELSNKPSVNGVTLNGNKTASDLGLANSQDQEDLAESVVALNSTVNGLASDVGDINTDIGTINENITTLQGKVATLEGNAYDSSAVDMWDYTKFPLLKTFFASCVVSVTPTTSTQQGSLYYSEAFTMQLPFTCTASYLTVSGCAENMHFVANASATSTTVSFRLVRGQAVSQNAVKVQLQVMGRYV